MRKPPTSIVLQSAGFPLPVHTARHRSVIPSRISLLTGIAPYKSGVYGNGEKLRQEAPGCPHPDAVLPGFGIFRAGRRKDFPWNFRL